MAQERSFDLSAFIEGRRLNAFNIRLIVLTWLITFFDGLDMMMIAYTAPYLAEDLAIDQTMLGRIFSAGLFGMLLGGFAFAWFGDLIGRRRTILISAVSFGLLTLATGFARDYTQLLFFRFMDGLALGGLLPLASALNIEYAPKRLRATVVTLIMVGYSLGMTFAGPMTNWIAPQHGWQAVFVVAGAATLACAAALFFLLPESIRFLAARGTGAGRIAAIVRQLDPQADVSTTSTFILADEATSRSTFRIGQLFEGRLAFLTPLIWLGSSISTLTVYLHGSWGPIILESLSVDRKTAALVSSVAALAGAGAGLSLMRFTDRIGPFAILVFPFLSLPVLLAMGLAQIPVETFLFLNVLVVALISGGHYGILSISAIYYPTAIRANGAGWASSIARLGGVAGPIIGAMFLSSGLPVSRIFLFMMLGPGVLALSVAAIGAIMRSEPTRAAPAE